MQARLATAKQHKRAQVEEGNSAPEEHTLAAARPVDAEKPRSAVAPGVEVPGQGG